MPVEPWAATPGSFEVVGGGRSTVVQRHDFQVRTGILEGDEGRDARTTIYRDASDHARSLASKVPGADDGRPGSVPADGIHPKILQSVGKSWTTERSRGPTVRVNGEAITLLPPGQGVQPKASRRTRRTRRARRRNGRAPLSGSSRRPSGRRAVKIGSRFRAVRPTGEPDVIDYLERTTGEYRGVIVREALSLGLALYNRTLERRRRREAKKTAARGLPPSRAVSVADVAALGPPVDVMSALFPDGVGAPFDRRSMP